MTSDAGVRLEHELRELRGLKAQMRTLIRDENRASRGPAWRARDFELFREHRRELYGQMRIALVLAKRAGATKAQLVEASGWLSNDVVRVLRSAEGDVIGER